jgi:hypothetical protein
MDHQHPGILPAPALNPPRFIRDCFFAAQTGPVLRNQE